MKNKKFIIINETNTYKDCEIFKFILQIIENGLVSNNKTTYQPMKSFNSTSSQVLIETEKTNYGYKIIAREKSRWQ